MRKPRLMAPGPAPVPEEVLLEMAKPVIHSRDPRTKEGIKLAVEGLQEVFRTSNEIAILAATGTGAMEAAAIHGIPPGKKGLVVNAGWFGLRWSKICTALGIEHETIDFDWGQPADPAKIAAALEGRDDIAMVMATLSETSTGTGHPIEAIGEIVAGTNALLAVDGISGVGAMECRTDDWKIDFLCVGSQKALMLPPGLAFVAISTKAAERMDSFEQRAFYFNLKAARKKLDTFDTPYTPAHSMIFGLVKALEKIKAEGVEEIWARHRRMSEACQAGVKALGLELFSARPAEGLTAFFVPEGIKDTDIRKKLDERFGITFVGGQDKLKGRIVRIGHMGYNDELDVIGALAALEMVLADLGHEIDPGAAVTAAQRVLIGQHTAVAAAL